MKTNPYGERVQLIADDMKQCFKDLGLKIHEEMPQGQGISIMSMFEYQSHNVGITASFYPEVNLVDIVLLYAQVPEEKLPRFLDLFNRINQTLVMSYYMVHPEHRGIQLRAAFRLKRYSLHKEEFKDTLKHCLTTGASTTSMPIKLMFTDESPESIVNEHLKSVGIIPPEFLGPDGEVLLPRVTEERPFIVEACADMPAFPTHTHGLNSLGMPEFLMDHLAFGPTGNSARINLSYDYFKKPENIEKLFAILFGETIKLTAQDLNPKANPGPQPYCYCYRRVYPDFEMVKQAYNLDDPLEVGPDTWFVQIYVEGDDFALTDEYYKGGIKW